MNADYKPTGPRCMTEQMIRVATKMACRLMALLLMTLPASHAWAATVTGLDRAPTLTARLSPTGQSTSSIVVDGQIVDWTGIGEFLTDPAGDTTDSPDVLSLKLTDDGIYLYFLLELAQPLADTTYFGNNHLYLYFDSDLNATTGCGGGEYLAAISLTQALPLTDGLGDMRDCTSSGSDFPDTVAYAISGPYVEGQITLSTFDTLSPGTPGLTVFYTNDLMGPATYWFDLTLDPSPLARFGRVEIGTSASRTVTVTNRGTEAAQVQNAVLVDDAAAAFTIETDGCTGQTLASQQTCVLSVQFQPIAAETATASLQISYSTGARSATIPLALQGTGVAVATTYGISGTLFERIGTQAGGKLRPLSGIIVNLRNATTGRDVATAVSDGDGGFSFTDLAAGSYLVEPDVYGESGYRFKGPDNGDGYTISLPPADGGVEVDGVIFRGTTRRLP